jgi:hypothetical protein
MIASNGWRAAVPCSVPLSGSTMARRAAIATLSSAVMGWVEDHDAGFGESTALIETLLDFEFI